MFFSFLETRGLDSSDFFFFFTSHADPFLRFRDMEGCRGWSNHGQSRAKARSEVAHGVEEAK